MQLIAKFKAHPKLGLIFLAYIAFIALGMLLFASTACWSCSPPYS